MTDASRRLRDQDRVIPFVLPSTDGGWVGSSDLAGRRFMLSFFRFASCPFCNLRLHELVRRFGELGDDFTIVAVFDSPIDNLRRHSDGHHAPFPIVADESGHVYRAYGVEKSILGVVRGMLLRLPTLLKAMLLHGYVPLVIKGSMTTMPADLLIDENGLIRHVWYGRDEGDHMPFETIRAFALREDEPQP